jgi:hypothetical protein
MMVGPSLECGHNADVRWRGREAPEAWCDICCNWQFKLTAVERPVTLGAAPGRTQGSEDGYPPVAVNMNDRRFSGAA